MGTHAMIGFYNLEDGSVEATYVHYDGYLEGVGRTLIDHYNSAIEAVSVSLVGYLSALEPNIHDSIANSAHKNQPVVEFESVEDYMTNGYDHAGADYLYLFDGDAWFYASRSAADNRFEEIEMNLKAA
jgi:hypothetical protein